MAATLTLSAIYILLNEGFANWQACWFGAGLAVLALILVRVPAAGEDVLQLGGDFVHGRDRRVVFAHPSRAATDRPTVDQILDAVRPK